MDRSGFLLETENGQCTRVNLTLSSQGVFIKQVLGHTVVGSIHLGEVGDVVTQFLYGLHLLVQVVSLQEVTQLMDNEEKCRK